MNLNNCVDLALEVLDPVLQSRFTSHPLQVLREDLHLTVRAVDHLGDRRDGGGACDGMSFLQDGVVLYAPTPASRRENFTLAHELGHWLIERTPAVVDWVADREDPNRMLETVCDRIAQRLLLPLSTLSRVFGTTPVRAAHIQQLYDTSQASEPVCAIALAARLPCLGAVVIIDRATWRVDYASIRPDEEQGWPQVFPWPGHPVPAGHPLKTLSPGSAISTKTSWRSPWGAAQPYYMDAVSGPRRVHAVLSEIDLWDAAKLHLDQPRTFDQRPTTEAYCCGRTRTVRGWPCSTCGEPNCPECGRCRCQRRELKEQPCQGCFQVFLPHLLVNSHCEDCR